MDIKEIAEQVSKRIYVEDGLLLSKFISEKFAEVLIESYKAELLKEVGEPVLYAEFAEDGGWLGDASEYAAHLEEPRALFTSDQVASAILKATKLVEDQLAAAQEENGKLRKDAETYGPEKIAIQKQAWLEADRQRQINDLKDQLAKAEQRVAEACALYIHSTKGVVGSINMAEAVLSGEWSKFAKEV